MGRCNQEWGSACECFSLRKTCIGGRTLLVPIVTSAPLEVVGMDFLSLRKSAETHKYLLVVTDLFSRFAWVIPKGPNGTDWSSLPLALGHSAL